MDGGPGCACAPDKIALLREPGAQHFKGGAFNRSLYASTADGPRFGECRCERFEPAASDHNRKAAVLLRSLGAELAPHAHVLPFISASARRHDMHPGGMCALRPARDREHRRNQNRSIASRALVPRRRCCDCTHHCYTPAFYDSTFFTPLYRILSQWSGVWRDVTSKR